MTLVDDRGRSGIESIDVIEMKAQQKAMVLPHAAAKGLAESLRRTSRSEVKHFADDYFLQARAFYRKRPTKDNTDKPTAFWSGRLIKIVASHRL